MSAIGTIIPSWTVYIRPTDFVDHVVARKFLIGIGHFEATEDHVAVKIEDGNVTLALEIVRKMILTMTPGLTRMHRMAADEPQIHEVWL